MKNPSSVANLVLFKNYLFPVEKQDVDVLANVGIHTTQLPAESLPIVKGLVKGKITFVVHSSSKVIQKHTEDFFADMASHGARCKRDANTFLISRNTNLASEHVDKIESHIKLLLAKMQRYCLRGNVQRRLKENSVLIRIDFSFDNNILNHLGYGSLLEASEHVEMQLAKLCKLRLSKRQVPTIVTRYIADDSGKKVAKKFQSQEEHLHLEILDADAGSYKAVMQRTFLSSDLKSNEILNIAKFLLSLTKKCKD